ncbi:TPA: hypothetical protein ACHFZX_002692 [Escherichia coli]|nr:hypothetical protein [Escherichia marmotae]MEC9985468.1 hypothetical protein [Escherichia marmotae]MED0055214.1 hypothetical protein [Escherichia marmotae]MED0111082.1 hypothetical protein [Escherichia marmotae]MED0120482.1 hypothetical protein [Escherichia marmotae]
MDNTIIGALIGAVIAIVSTYINARQGYKNSIRLERQKILRDKREQLFINCMLAEKVIASSEITILNFVKNARHHSDSKFDVSKANPLQTMEMLINIYLPEYKKDLQELNNAYQKFHKYYSKYTTPDNFKDMPYDEKVKFISEANSYAKKIYGKLNDIKVKISSNSIV